MNLRAWLRDILLSLLIATAVVVFLYQPVKVEGTSMLPQLVDEQRIFVNKFVYRLDNIERGDVVVFGCPRIRAARTSSAWSGCPAKPSRSAWARFM